MRRCRPRRQSHEKYSKWHRDLPLWPVEYSARVSLAPFKVLHRFFVFLGRSACLERAQIPSLPCLRVFLSRIQSVAGFNFSNHDSFLSRGNTMPVLPARVSIVNFFKSTLAGPLVTFPVRTSKHELCHGHWTLKPSKSLSES